MRSSVTPTPVNQSSYEPVRQSSACSTGNYRASPARHLWCLVPALRRHAEVTPVDRDAWLGACTGAGTVRVVRLPYLLTSDEGLRVELRCKWKRNLSW